MFPNRFPQLILHFCLFIVFMPVTWAQSLISYSQYQKSGHELSLALTACSPGGNFAEAQSLLNQAYWQQNPKERILLQTLLLWNVYGRERAMAFDDSLRSSGTACHNELYTKTWLAFYSKSNDDYTYYISRLLQREPEDRLTTRLRTEVMLQGKGPAWGKSSPLTSNQAFIDRILAGNLNEEERVFYLLARCQTMGYGRNAERYADSVICALWLLYPDQMHRGSVKYHTEKCALTECRQIFEKIDREDKAAAPQTPGYKVRGLLYEFMAQHKKTSGSIPADTALENSLRRILQKESNPLEKEKLRGLIKYGSNGAYQTSMEKSGRSSRGKEIIYSPDFTTLLKSTLPKKELFDLMMSELNSFVELSKSAGGKEIGMDTLGLRMKREYAKFTEEDLSVMTGIMISSQYLLDELKENPIYAKSNLLQQQMSARYLKSWPAYFGFLGKNPLYKSDYTFYPSGSNLYPKNTTELLSCVSSYDSLVTRYPGALFIKQARLRFISHYCDSFPEMRPQLYGMLLAGLIDLTDRDQNTVIEPQREFEHIRLTKEDSEYLTYSLAGLLDLFKARIEAGELKRLKQQLADKAKARPYQENLKRLNFYLN